MNRIPLVLTVIGFVLLAAGIVIVFANPLVASNTISCSGQIAYPNEEIDSTENNSETIDARGYIPIVAGVGLLSIVFLDKKLRKKKR